MDFRAERRAQRLLRVADHRGIPCLCKTTLRFALCARVFPLRACAHVEIHDDDAAVSSAPVGLLAVGENGGTRGKGEKGKRGDEPG